MVTGGRAQGQVRLALEKPQTFRTGLRYLASFPLSRLGEGAMLWQSRGVGPPGTIVHRRHHESMSAPPAESRRPHKWRHYLAVTLSSSVVEVAAESSGVEAAEQSPLSWPLCPNIVLVRAAGPPLPLMAAPPV